MSLHRRRVDQHLLRRTTRRCQSTVRQEAGKNLHVPCVPGRSSTQLGKGAVRVPPIEPDGMRCSGGLLVMDIAQEYAVDR